LKIEGLNWQLRLSNKPAGCWVISSKSMRIRSRSVESRHRSSSCMCSKRTQMTFLQLCLCCSVMFDSFLLKAGSQLLLFLLRQFATPICCRCIQLNTLMS